METKTGVILKIRKRDGRMADFNIEKIKGALSSAFANDVSPELTFAQQVCGYGAPGDALLAISTSGNAQNCCLAAAAAKAKRMRIISLSGPDGGKLANLADCALKAPGGSTADVQENHLPVYHTLCAMLEEKVF